MILRRLSILFRGPGILFLILVAALAVTAMYKNGHTAHTAAATLVPSPIGEATAAPSPLPAPRITPTPRPAPTPVITTRYSVSLPSHLRIRNPVTGFEVKLVHSSVRLASRHGGGPKSGHIWLLLQVTLQNRGRRTGHVSHESFYSIDKQSGQTYAANVHAGDIRLLSAQTVAKGKSITRWIGFDVPRRGGSFLLIWNDNNRLLPPGQLGGITIHEVSRRP